MRRAPATTPSTTITDPSAKPTPAGPPHPPAPGPIGRGAHARERIIRAALDLLADEGLPGLTMEAVARRARASKATLYRHWDSPNALLVDAMDATFQPLPLPAHDDLRSDLVAMLSQVTDMLVRSPFPRLMAAFIDAAERNPEIAGLHAHLTGQRRAPFLTVLSRARDDGRITPDVNLELVVDLLTAPFFYNRFISHRHIHATLVTDVVDHVLRLLEPQ